MFDACADACLHVGMDLHGRKLADKSRRMTRRARCIVKLRAKRRGLTKELQKTDESHQQPKIPDNPSPALCHSGVWDTSIP